MQANLTVYAMPSQKPAFLTSLLTTLDELKSYCITGEQLTQVGEETEGLDGEKLRDLGLIFGAYEAMTARGRWTPGPTDPFGGKAEAVSLFQGQDVYLDGFTDFTPQQGLVLAELLRQAHFRDAGADLWRGGWGGGGLCPGEENSGLDQGAGCQGGLSCGGGSSARRGTGADPAPAPFGAGAFCPSHALLYRPLGR